jgi:hypothetical protein
MTEAEWRTNQHPLQLLDFVSPQLPVRKRRLIAVAAVRTIPPDVLGGDGERWLVGVERAAERNVELPSSVVGRWIREHWRGRAMAFGHPSLHAVCFQVGLGDLRTTMVNVGYVRGATPQHYDVADEPLANVARDVAGNPFRPVTFSPSWRTDTALSLARQMYEARDFAAMPILADALQDAGCDSDDILSQSSPTVGVTDLTSAGAGSSISCWERSRP